VNGGITIPLFLSEVFIVPIFLVSFDCLEKIVKPFLDHEDLFA